VQGDMAKRAWWTPLAYPFQPLTLYDFTNPNDAADAKRTDERDLDGWRISDDGVIGGYSKSMASFVPGGKYNQQQEDGTTKTTITSTESGSEISDHVEDDDEDEDNEADQEENEYDDDDPNLHLPSTERIPLALPHLRWEGHVDTAIGLESKFDRAGFAALRSPEFPYGGVGLLGGYDALEVVCRSDARVYTVNLTVESMIPNDVYQGHIVTNQPASLPEEQQQPLSSQQWNTLYLPFIEFGSGRRRLENKIRLESIGFTLMDGKNGPFQFDVARIRAVNFWEGCVWEGPETLKRRKFR